MIKLSEAQKVALLLVSLGESSVKMIAPYLSKEEFKKISHHINEMHEVDSDLAQKVVEEFYQKLQDFEEEETQPALDRSSKDILTILHDADTKQLAEYLRNEPIQATITMLAYLEPNRTGAILSEFPWDQQCEIVAGFEGVQSRDHSTALYRLGPAKFAAEILNHLSPEARIELLEALKLQNPNFFEQVSQYISLPENEIFINRES